MPATPFFVAAAIFLFLAASAYTLYLGLYDSHSALAERLNHLALKVRISDGLVDESEEGQEGLAKLLLEWAVQRLPAPKLDIAKGEKLAQTLSHAGFYRPGAIRIFQVAQLCSIAGFALLAFVIGVVTASSASRALIYIVGGVVLGGCAPGYYVSKRARKRQVRLGRELSDIVDLLVTCIEAGLGIFEALRTVGREAERQGRLLGTELSMMSGELAAGSSLAQGLRALAERVGVDDIRSLAAILIQSEKLGSQMAPALRASSDALRTKRRLRAEEAAQKSTIKMLIPLVLFVLPAMLIVIVGPALIQIIHTLQH